MSNMVISIFQYRSLAENARAGLLAKDRDGSLGLQDAITVERTSAGKIKLHHLDRFTLGGAVGGAFLGVLFGILFLNPIFALAGIVVGFIIGAVSGNSTHIGIDSELVRAEAEIIEPGQSALCIMSDTNANRLVAEIQKFEGNLGRTAVCILEGETKRCSIRQPNQGMGPGIAVL